MNTIKQQPASPPASTGKLLRGLVKLARPKQWTKGIFVLIGPIFALSDGTLNAANRPELALQVALAFFAFCLSASGCYVFNDLADIERDRAHPRKRFRPLASGTIPIGIAKVFGVCLLLAGFGCALLVPGVTKWWVAGFVVAYIFNVSAYSARLKHIVIIDVLSLSTGFVLRVLGGCAAVNVAPSTWLLNATLFLSMFLAFGKRLGERRLMGSDESAIAARDVQLSYTDQLLRMLVVVTGVATLLTYTGYIQSREDDLTRYFINRPDGLGHGFGMNLLWISVLPATLALLRTITLLMRGAYDDPTELALKDNVVRISGLLFVLSTAIVLWIGGNS
ncbi:MAG: UbiA prenyltransferase family protein [Phycisphaerales bacterium]|nr:UbiA prenyltransferase family protein [Phycisphaerales bacterium]